MKEKLPFEELYKKVEEFRRDKEKRYSFPLSHEFKMVEEAGWNWSEFNSQYLRYQFRDVKVNEAKLPYEVVALEYDRLTGGDLFREVIGAPSLDPTKINKLISTLENSVNQVAEYLGACGWEYVEFMDERNRRAGVSFPEVKEKFDKVEAMLKKNPTNYPTVKKNNTSN